MTVRPTSALDAKLPLPKGDPSSVALVPSASWNGGLRRVEGWGEGEAIRSPRHQLLSRAAEIGRLIPSRAGKSEPPGVGICGSCAQRAFTLVEIMIAIAIFSMVLAAIYASWTAILRGASAAQKAAAEVQRNRMTLSAVETALFSAQMFNANIGHYWFISDTSGDFGYLSLVSRLPASFPGSGLFGDQVVRRVTFSVEAGAGGQNQLLLQQKPLLEATNSNEERPYTIVLARDVSLFLLEFWDSRLNDWAGEWLYTNQLPRLMRVTVGTGNRGSRYSPQPEEVISRVVALGGTNIAADIQQPRPAGAPIMPGAPGAPGGRLRPGPGGNDGSGGVMPIPPGPRPINPGATPRPIQPPGRRPQR